MKVIYKIIMGIIILTIVIISVILIINNDQTRILQSIEYSTPHYSILKSNNNIVTVEYTQNMSPKIVTTYSYTEGKLTERKMEIFCENKMSAKELYKGLDNNNKFSIEKVTINKNVVTTTVPEENIPIYEKEISTLSTDQLYDFLIEGFGTRGAQRIQ